MRRDGLSARIRALFATSVVGAGLLSVAVFACVGENPDTNGSSSGGADATAADADAGSSSSVDGSAPRCVSGPPSDWQGPVAVRLETDPTGRSCDPTWSAPVALAGVGPPGGPTTCAECSCGPATGGTCASGANLLRFGTDNTCTNPDSTYVSTSTCTTLGQTVGNYVEGVPPAAPTPGACSPDGGAPTARPPPFGQYARVCALPSAPLPTPECEGKLPVPALESPGEWALCVYQKGDIASCPLGSPFTDGRLVVASQFTDDRACSACGCAPPTGLTCSAYTTRLYALDGCSGFQADVPHDGSCSASSVTFKSFALLQAPTLASQGSCTTTGGAPTGAVTTSEKITLCCLPP